MKRVLRQGVRGHRVKPWLRAVRVAGDRRLLTSRPAEEGGDDLPATQPSSRPESKLANNTSNQDKGKSLSASTNSTDTSIDDMFQSLKDSKQQKARKAEIEHKEEVRTRRRRREEEKKTTAENSSGERFGFVSPEAPVHRIDEATGLPVYKAHLLKVGEGGGTPLCPFDCNCCF